MDKIEKDLESILDDNSPKIEGKFVVGSVTEFNTSYTKGESKWTQQAGLVGADGQPKMVQIINGKWTISK